MGELAALLYIGGRGRIVRCSTYQVHAVGIGEVARVAVVAGGRPGAVMAEVAIKVGAVLPGAATGTASLDTEEGDLVLRKTLAVLVAAVGVAANPRDMKVIAGIGAHIFLLSVVEAIDGALCGSRERRIDPMVVPAHFKVLGLALLLPVVDDGETLGAWAGAVRFAHVGPRRFDGGQTSLQQRRAWERNDLALGRAHERSATVGGRRSLGRRLRRVHGCRLRGLGRVGGVGGKKGSIRQALRPEDLGDT